MGLMDYLGIGPSGSQSKALKAREAAFRRIGNITEAESARIGEREAARQPSILATLGLLGAPGTYGEGLTAGTGAGDIYTTPTATGGTPAQIRRQERIARLNKKKGKEGLTQSGVLDPTKVSQAISSLPTTQIMSQLTAESKQLLDESGPLWTKLHQGITNPIIEGSALALRDQQRYIKDQLAKGGTARRDALAGAQNLLAIEASNRLRAQELWQAETKLRFWARDNARQQVASNTQYVQGLIDPYVTSLNQASQYIIGTAVPMMAQAADATTQAKIARADAEAKKHQFIGKMIFSAAAVVGAGVAGAALGGGAIGASVGSTAGGAVGSSFGATSLEGPSSGFLSNLKSNILQGTQSALSSYYSPGPTQYTLNIGKRGEE